MIVADYGFYTDYKRVFYTIKFNPVMDLFIQQRFICEVEYYHERHQLLHGYHP